MKGPIYLGHGIYRCGRCNGVIARCRCFDHPKMDKFLSAEHCPACQSDNPPPAYEPPPLRNFD